MAGLGAAGATVSSALPGVARAAACPVATNWGEITCSLSWGSSAPASKVLEIYLQGGCAPWESFYFRPGAGGTTRGFDTQVGNLVWNTAAHCAPTPSGLVDQYHADDSSGKPVHLGPFALPLWRTDIASSRSSFHSSQ